MTPTSYQGPRADGEQDATMSQDTSLAFDGVQSKTEVAQLLAEKGSDVFAVTNTLSLASVVTELSARAIGNMPVINIKGELVGVISERDIVRAVAEGSETALEQPVSSHMTRAPRTCRSSDRVADVMKIMSEGRFRHMPVVDDGALVGVISIRDIVTNRVQELEYEALRIKQLVVG